MQTIFLKFSPDALISRPRALSAVHLGLVVAALLLSGCPPRAESPGGTASPGAPSSGTNLAQHTPPAYLQKFCGNCHQFPAPSFFPKDTWYAEVQRGFNFYTDSGRTDLQVPPVAEVVAWYREQAPAVLPTVPLLPASQSPVRFRQQLVANEQRVPIVSGVTWDAQPGAWPALRWNDLARGGVVGLDPRGDGRLVPVTQVAHAAVNKLIDVDGDGLLDLVICELGTKLPGDHQLGQLLCLPGADPGSSPRPLLKDVGRVADVTAADLDGDGDLDLVVAEFGWIKTGRILLLENIRSREKTTAELTPDDYRVHVLDPRHGTIHVRIADLNRDGLPDIVALISQEYETVVAYLNGGGLQFSQQVVMAPQDPSFGSCSIELVDLDRDGQLDILYCNGDTLDSHLVKPYHGVHVLLNRGSYPFEMQRILTLPGASATAVADFDGDGDLDIAVSAYLPENLLSQLPAGEFDTLCLLEQTEPMLFVPHSLRRGRIGHLCLTQGDFDGDGRPDLAVGNTAGESWGSLWWNLGPANSPGPVLPVD